MKKGIRFLILTFIFILLFSVVVSASSNTYKLSELGVDITIPDGYKVITRTTPENAAVFSELGRTKSDVIEQFQASNIYLNAISDKYNEEIVITMVESNMNNLNLIGDTSLNTFISTIANEYTDYGFDVSKHEIYQNSQNKFAKLYFTDASNSVYGLQYYTLYNGKAMNFTMRSYEGKISSRQEGAIKTIVDSIKYDVLPSTAIQNKDTDAFVYTDVDSGVVFTVPANWGKEEFSKDRDFIDVKFVSTKDDGCIMIFGSNDVWGQMADSEKWGYSRSDIRTSAFSKADIADMFDMTVDRISVVTYNGVQYYKGETAVMPKAYGLDFSIPMTVLVCVHNGWMYMFQFGGTSDHKMFSDFEKLINSVQYPSVSNADLIAEGYNIIWIGIVVIVLAGVIVKVLLNKRKKTEIKYSQDNDGVANNIEQTVSCHNCGQILPLDGKFCHACGAKINKEGNEL